VNVAIVHDSFVQSRGGERVAVELVAAFDSAPLFTAAFRPDRLPRSLRPEDVGTSFVQPLVRRGVPLPVLAPLLPAAFTRIDVGQAELVVSSSSAFAHHVRVPPGAAHMCYCHTPPRFLWDAEDYFRDQRPRRRLTWPGRAAYRQIDRAASRRVDLYVANSQHTAARIRHVYGREALVVNPPVDVARFQPSRERSGRFVVVSALRNQKRIDVAIQAANQDRLPLDVIGEGPERKRLERLAGPTVRILGRRDDKEVRAAMARSAGILVPAMADFGLTLVEAQASGRPPIAFAAGGALEIIHDGHTGFLFDEQTPEALARAMRRALEVDLSPAALVASAGRFDVARFRSEIRSAAELALELRLTEDAGRWSPAATPASQGLAPVAGLREPRHGV
jgi:glycosyltransferase involved in cell wall biosynthesis